MRLRVSALRTFNRCVLERMEYAVWQGRTSANQQSRPVFVLGAPRSGSTVLTQALIIGLAAEHLTNLQCRAYGYPALFAPITRRLARRQATNLSSNYGNTAGLGGFSECGAWWYRFFRKDDLANGGFDAQRDRFLASINSLVSRSSRPYVFKNLFNCHRIREIAANTTAPVFVVVTRDVQANAVSILNGRYAANKNYHDWWSVPVRGMMELQRRPPEEQVVEQIVRIREAIDDALDDALARNDIDDTSIVRINYEDFCVDVVREIKRIGATVFQSDPSLLKTEPLPASLAVRYPILADPDVQALLNAYLDRIK